MPEQHAPTNKNTPVEPAAKPLEGLAALIDAALPQTQCTRCGYPDCAAYARAIAANEAAINQCPPGGEEGVVRLAAITSQSSTPLNPDNGFEGPLTLAVIDENWCIGCTLCLKVCPTDAIVGANKRMHTVIAEHCTGCELCIPVCPVDCISLDNISGASTGWAAWSEPLAEHARSRYAVHLARQRHIPAAAANARAAAVAAESLAEVATPAPASAVDPKKAMIAAAMARARAQRGQS
ncbi:RnfABCDGE type electron transport complex subunit B [Diaphorobacter sp. HDW4A]|uniref:RnfABCDGE type electron transport complex subunit B n=1 Tax=Diaphorobacter sp. HDW4A TaxID=2714924 RepID=UPI0014084BD5|nr:RnfABCDGE type electron transport complex subunit B [Diaphorobacter sp. HDW4A]QIL80081.1 RnfABCDGE type electron transport complex subunit B [Diaphorobacter sp. HDW4A]